MPRYEYKDEKSNKFWEISISGSEVTTKWGKIGSDGQSKTKDHDTAEKAKKEYDKLIKSKTKKGYELADEIKQAAEQLAEGEATPGFTRYEYRSANSQKFWEIRREGSEVTTRWGKIGSKGQEKTKELDDDEASQKEYDRLVKSKTKKGYELVGSAASNNAVAAQATNAANPELEADIVKDPDNAEAWLVYGDWLQAQGDPRGEWIAIDAAVLDGSKELKQSKAFFKKHKDYFIEGLEDYYDHNINVVSWHMGFMKTVHVGAGYEDEHSAEDALTALLDHPSARFIQKLVVGPERTEDIMPFDWVFAFLADKQKPVALRELEVGNRDLDTVRKNDSYNPYWDISSTEIGFEKGFSTAFKHLRRLRVEGGYPTLKGFDFPELRDFEVWTGGLPQETVAEISKANWPNLERLHILFGMENYGSSCSVDGLKSILNGKGLGKLKHLGLKNAEFTDDICNVLHESKVLEQLETLDLSMGTMTDAGAQVMAEHADAYSHLKRLDLSDNAMSDAAEDIVKDLCDDVSFGSQEPDKAEDPDWRYTTVGE